MYAYRECPTYKNLRSGGGRQSAAPCWHGGDPTLSQRTVEGKQNVSETSYIECA